MIKQIKFALSLTFLFSAFSFSNLSHAEETDCSDDTRYPEISKTELKSVVEEKRAFIVDVNSDKSFKKAHVPGAIHYKSHKAEFAQLLPEQKDALIVAYCGGPSCTAWKAAAENACKLGYSNIKHFKPGISGWVKKG